MATSINLSQPDVPFIGYSDTTPLGAGASYDSGILDWQNFNQVQTHLLSDQDGTLVITMYADAAGTDSVRTLTIPYIGGSGYQFFSAPVFSSYIRYVYTNGATPQTDFYIETRFLKTAISPQVLGAEAFISDSMTSQLNRSILVGKDASAVYRNALVSTDGALITGDFLTEAGKGNLPGLSGGNKFGRTVTLGAGSAVTDVWNVLGLYTGFPVSAVETVTLVSTDAADTQDVTIFGLDGSGNEQSETITLTGLVPVVSVNSWSRVNRLTVDSGTDNAGTITVVGTVTPANVFISVAPGRNQSTVAAYTVPAGKTMEIVNLYIACSRTNGSPGSVEATLRVREPGGVFRAIRVYEVTNSLSAQPTLNIPIVLPALTDVVVRVEDVSDGGTTVTAEFGYILRDV